MFEPMHVWARVGIVSTDQWRIRVAATGGMIGQGRSDVDQRRYEGLAPSFPSDARGVSF